METISDFLKSLVGTSEEIKAYKPTCSTPVMTASGRYSIAKWTEHIVAKKGVTAVVVYPEFIAALSKKFAGLETAIWEHCENIPPEEEEPSLVGDDGVIETHHMRFNINIGNKETEELFLTSLEDDSIIKNMNANAMAKACGLTSYAAAAKARKVFVEYLPRAKSNLHTRKAEHKDTLEETVLNKYTKPNWQVWKEQNPDLFRKLPYRLPKLAKHLIEHLIPIPEERQYFYAWAWASMTSRARVMLLLCGEPGCGKNRLKFLLQSLHGSHNTTDGKESALKSKFNTQLKDNTLIWFDELHFDLSMSNRLKEAENDTIAIEAKGVDATRSTEIHSSVVISNNFPRHNYILFEDRKYAPLLLNSDRLEKSLSSDEISELTNKLNELSPDYDPAYVAQIAKFILHEGAQSAPRWPRLEYKGPMFWRLCHTSMKKSWRAVINALISPAARGNKAASLGYDEERDAFLWSKLEYYIKTMNKELEIDTRPTCEDFFRKFRDFDGNPVFDVFRSFPGKPDPVEFDDFYIRVPKTPIKFYTASKPRSRPEGIDDL